MTEAEWNMHHVKCLGVRLSGDAVDEVDESEATILGDTILYVMNASPDLVAFTLPSFDVRPQWESILDSFDERRVGQVYQGGAAFPLYAHSVTVFTMRDEEGGS
jgi:glycogen operon protein